MSSYCQANFVTARVRVALIIEGGKLKPVWFEETANTARDKVYIKTVNMIWTHHEGTAKVIDFAVTGVDANCYKLSLNTREFTWQLWVTETTW